MAEFNYRALDPQGQARTGVLEADNEGLAINRIREQGWTPLEVKVYKAGLNLDIKIPFLSDRISLKDVAVSSRQLATMIDAGLPLMRAI
ncbi:MAG: type II secretion system F family protein, partial [Actinomycetota bacterium]